MVNPMSSPQKSPESQQQGAGEDIKEKFREALAKKNQRDQPHDQAGPAESKAHGTHGRAGNDKTFRRKAG